MGGIRALLGSATQVDRRYWMTGDTRPQPRVAVVGSIMLDMIAYATPLPKAGETVTGSRFETGFGGKERIKQSWLPLLGQK